MEGWIKLHRKIFDWEWFDSANHFKLWCVLLLKASHKDSCYRGENLRPGQLLTGRKQLASTSKLSEQQVRSILDDFKASRQITIKSTKKYSVITIVNWEDHNLSNHENNQQITNKQPSDNQEATTFKNVNNANNENNININGAKTSFNPTSWLSPEKNSQEILKKPSPLSFLFDHMPEVQAWLDMGNHHTHLLMVKKFAPEILVAEVQDMYSWAKRNEVRAETWMLNRLNNKNIAANGAKRPQKSFSRKTNGVTPTPENPTGDPYLQEALDRGLVG